MFGAVRKERHKHVAYISTKVNDSSFIWYASRLFSRKEVCC